MELFIVRHGIAQARGTAGLRSDAERSLTPKGRQRARQAAEGLRAMGCRPGRIGTSPLPRAEQTARIIGEALGCGAAVEVCQFLAPGANADDVTPWLGQDDVDAMIVGHMPDVADIASELLSGGGRLSIVFKKSAACCIAFDGRPAAGEGRLEWLIQPRQLRSLPEK